MAQQEIQSKVTQLFDPSTFLTQQETAEFLRVTVPTVIKLRKLGKLKFVELGKDGCRKKPLYPKSQFFDAGFSSIAIPEKL